MKYFLPPEGDKSDTLHNIPWKTVAFLLSLVNQVQLLWLFNLTSLMQKNYDVSDFFENECLTL